MLSWGFLPSAMAFAIAALVTLYKNANDALKAKSVLRCTSAIRRSLLNARSLLHSREKNRTFDGAVFYPCLLLQAKLNCPGAKMGSTPTLMVDLGANLPSSSSLDRGFSMRC